ncbi:glycosyltransferase [Shewanella sp. 10N.286.52.C2]|uniref:glycosyltransferase n=1 Tax=Shewanella sp. 10N.286.52.C2 TaxID=1880838 RepID=UPI00105686DB|nr:glycosyltransferase [Shewanella sp. 10N.286.52.C2]
MKKILLVCDYFYPAYKAGGPIKSISNILALFSGLYKFDVFTSSYDIDGTKLNVGGNNAFIGSDYKGCDVCYFDGLIKMARFILFKHLSYDIVYLNSFFSFQYSILYQVFVKLSIIKSNKIIIAPRGELTKGAMDLKSFKKQLFISLYRLLCLKNNVKFQFTSKEEYLDAVEVLGSIDYCIIPNIAEKPEEFIVKDKKNNCLHVVFLSRISKKKNLLSLCESISLIDTNEILFTIAGNVEDEPYWESCKKVLGNCSNNVTVDYVGPLDKNQVKSLLRKTHLFCLPTLNENYGHAIVEALSYSNLVLISDQTPWCDVVNYGSQVVRTDEVEKMVEYINIISKLTADDFNILSSKSYMYIVEKIVNHNKLVGGLFDE